MQVFTFPTLTQALQDWPEDSNDEYVTNLPNIIGLGELRLVKDLNLEIFDARDTTPIVTLGNRAVTKPLGLIVQRSIYLVTVGVRSPVYLRSWDYCLHYAPDPSAMATPKYFCELDETTWHLVPTPAANATLDVHFVKRPTSLLDEDETWLGTNCGDSLFAACLMEAEHYLKADDRYGDMKTKYYEELLPVARLELRDLIRSGSYDPYKPAARPAGQAQQG